MTLYEQVYIATNIIFVFSVYKLFNAFFNESKINLIKIKSLVLYYVLLTTVIFITRIPLITFFINLCCLFLITLTYQSTFQKKLFALSSVYSFVLIIELVFSGIFGHYEFAALENNSFNSAIILILLRVSLLIISHVVSRCKFSVSKYSIPRIYYIAYSVVLFGTLHLFISLLENSQITITRILINATVLILVNITMIIVDEKIYKSLAFESEKNLLKQQAEAYKNQYEIINQGSETIKALRHDFKNHLIMLSSLYKNNDSAEIDIYINNLLGKLDSELYSNSNNFVIDSIINFKLNHFKNSGIQFLVDVSVPNTLNIMSHDLTIILANLLDNAIDASAKSVKKFVDIRISEKIDNIIILIDNSYDGNIIVENDKFITTKTFKTNHGVGMQNIKDTVVKYGGEIEVEYTADVFSVSIILPTQHTQIGK